MSEELNFPVWLYRHPGGEAFLCKTKEHFDGMKDRALWKTTPWRNGMRCKCKECEEYKSMIAILEDEARVKDGIIANLEEELKTQSELLKSRKSKG